MKSKDISNQTVWSNRDKDISNQLTSYRDSRYCHTPRTQLIIFCAQSIKLHGSFIELNSIGAIDFQ